MNEDRSAAPVGLNTPGALTPRLKELLDETEPEFLLELIDTFLQHGDEWYQDVTVSASEHDIKRLEKAAHTLKGASANMGEADLVTACQMVEYSAREGSVNTDGLHAIGNQFRKTMERFQIVKHLLEQSLA